MSAGLSVCAQPLSYTGRQTLLVRVTDVQTQSFTLYAHEAPDKDGNHTTETVSWLVVEAGTWEVADGVHLEVGTRAMTATVGANVSNDWETVYFAGTFSADPVVLSQVQTNNDTEWVNTRQKNVGTTTFQVALEEAEVMTQAHGMEVVGWLAIDAGEGSWDGHAYEAGQTSSVVTNTWYTHDFCGGDGFATPYGQVVLFVASLATYNGSDNAHLRYRNLDADGVEVKVEEDTTADTEMNHTNAEVVHYLAVVGRAQGGGLTGQAVLTETVYYHFGGQRVAMRKGDVVYYTTGDHLGTTSLVLRQVGSSLVKVAESRHYPYGEERWSWTLEGTFTTDYRFTGQRLESSLGSVYHMGARFYDSYLARWLSADTLVPDPETPQSFNRYSWVLGNPLCVA